MATIKFFLAVVACGFILAGCGSSPIGPQAVPSGVDLTGYYDGQTTAYYKVYSDYSQYQFEGYDTVDGHVFYMVRADANSDNGGQTFFYDSRGLEGYQNAGESITWYDKPYQYLPDRVPFDSLYTIGTSYTYSGHHISVTTTYMLVDTEVVSLPFGIFRGVAHFIFQWKVLTDSIATYGSWDDWYAKGPGEVKIWYESDNVPILMETGNVNGVLWGPPRSGSVASHETPRSTPSAKVRTMVRGVAFARSRTH